MTTLFGKLLRKRQPRARPEHVQRGEASSDPQHLWIPGNLPGLNQILDARGMGRSFAAARWDGYNALKKTWSQKIAMFARLQSFQRTAGGWFTYLFVEPNKRRDPSNIIGGGMKIIEDALVDAGLLDGDGWKQVAGVRPYWMVRPEKIGALVVVHPKRALKFQEARDLFETVGAKGRAA